MGINWQMSTESWVDGSTVEGGENVNVLSLFDGMSCGRLALERSGIAVDNYFASEVDKHAIEVSQKNHPNTIQLGDVTKWREWDLPEIDLIIGGSPCQGFSFAGKQLNFDDPRSKLFFDFVDIVNFHNPEYFLLENVKMKKEYQEVISEAMGVEPIKINSKLVSAQNRERLYWTNIEGVLQPEDRNILLESLIDSGEVDRDKSYCIDANYFKGTNAKAYIHKSRRQLVWTIPEATKKGYVEVSEGQCIDLTFIRSKTRRGRLMLEKSNCLTAANYNYCKVTKDWFRKLTPVECERLQTLPDNYTAGVSDSQRYKMLGNGWTVEVIAHIFQNIKIKELIEV